MYDYQSKTPMKLRDFVATAQANIREIEPVEANKLRTSNPDLVIIDVREPFEYQQTGHIPGARLIPRGILEAAADPSHPMHTPELTAARERPILVYCSSGGRSAMACAVLQLMGFTRVMNLRGGFIRWCAENLPLRQEARYE